MQDLIKITSRRTKTNIITFYFRIPKYADYKKTAKQAEEDLINSKPDSKYPWATKRDTFEEMQMSFEFETDEKAKTCIE